MHMCFISSGETLHRGKLCTSETLLCPPAASWALLSFVVLLLQRLFLPSKACVGPLSKEFSYKHLLVPPTPSPSLQLPDSSSSHTPPSPIQSPPKFPLAFSPFPELLDPGPITSTGLLHQPLPDTPHIHSPSPACCQNDL